MGRVSSSDFASARALNSALEKELNQNFDVMVIGGIQESLPQLKTYDLILLLDVLEHLSDQTATLRKLSKPNGSVIVSFPIPPIFGFRFLLFLDTALCFRMQEF